MAFEQKLTHPPAGHPPNVEDNYTLIESELLIPHPDDWGGAYVDGNVLVLLTVTESVGEARQTLTDLGIRGGVEVRKADVSMADLDRAVTAIADDKNRPANVRIVGPQYSRSAIVVGVDDSNATSLSGALTLPEVAGIPLIAYDSGEPKQTSRYYDSSPYYGGDNTPFGTSTAWTNGCSSAFAWTHPTSGYHMLSAAHCYAYADGAFRGSVWRVLSGGSSTKIGNVSWSSGSTDGTKVGHHGDFVSWTLASGSSGTKVFAGTYNASASTARTIKGRTSLAENWHGTTLRSSGAGGYYLTGDGEIDPDWISLVNQTITYSDGQTYNGLSVAEDNSDCVTGGDSGGAFYLQSGTSNAYGVGIISGSNNQGELLTNCRNYYTPLSYVAADYGGSIKTG